MFANLRTGAGGRDRAEVSKGSEAALRGDQPNSLCCLTRKIYVEPFLRPFAIKDLASSTWNHHETLYTKI